MKTDTATQHIMSITNAEVERYSRYLGYITPVTHADLFRRWLFAFASVHTTWKLNCQLYRLLAPLDWLGNYDILLNLITRSGAGLQNNRAKYIAEFSEFFWDRPAWFWKNGVESWGDYRDRLRHVTKGIGRAKSSFVVELTYPNPAQVICTDTHVMQLYGTGTETIRAGRVTDKAELAMETHWVDTCNKHAVAPAISRWVFWDRKQGYSDPRYWSFVFEPENAHEIFRQRTIALT